MVIYFTGTNGVLERRRQYPANLLLNLIKEIIPKVHITKAKQTCIVESFKDLYHEHWSNSKG